MGQKILHGQTLDICAACGGIWIDRDEMGPLLKTPAEFPSAEALAALKKDLEWSASYDGAPSRLCPKCEKRMARHLFAALSGIALDYCSADGIWCDPAELDRLAEFIDKGGLQLARLTRWEEAIPINTSPKSDPQFPRVMKVLHHAASLFGK